MRYRLIFYFLANIFILLTGCASTSITSYVDPDYTLTKFNNILIVANTNRLDYRVSLEHRLANVFIENGVSAKESYLVLPPTRNFTDSQKIDIMLKNRIDCYLMVNFGESGVITTQLPVIGTNTKGEVKGNKYESTTTIIGGEVFKLPYAEFEMKLYDIKNGNMAWIANSSTGGGAYSNFNTVYNSFCVKTVDKLSEDNLIKVKKDITEINTNEEIDRILKERVDKPNQNKTDVLVLKNGEIFLGIILIKYEFGWDNTLAVIIQDKDEVKHKIIVENIKEEYQK